MRKAINDPKNVVREALEGLADLNAHLALLDTENIMIQANAAYPPDHVAIICGGGSGHEPAHAAYVGNGMLDAAVAGEVFNSPSVDTVLAAIRTVAGPHGVLLIVTNYTGDRLNFGLAAELARAENIAVEIVIVADDVALPKTAASHQRRGIAGTILVNKIAGAIAASGADLLTVKKLTQAAADDTMSMGVAFGPCTLPGLQEPTFTLPPEEIEIGLGLHGEKGVSRGPQQPANALVEILLNAIIKALNVGSTDHVALLINGLGSTTPLELNIIARHALAYLRTKNIHVERAWAGNFMTSLEMPGFSLSIMQLKNERIAYLDHPVQTAAWPHNNGHIPLKRTIRAAPTPSTPSLEDNNKPNALPNNALRDLTYAIADALEKAEPLITTLDREVGDGDLGLSICRAANAMHNLPIRAFASPRSLLETLSSTLRKVMSGSSGPLYATGLLAAAHALKNDANKDTNKQTWTGRITPAALANAFNAAVHAISLLGAARLGDRTMIDALQPAADAFSTAIKHHETIQQALQKAVLAAEAGVKKTTNILPKLGRAIYLGERALGTPDPGASVVVVWLNALYENKFLE